MLSILGKQQQSYCDGISRRSFLKIGGLALGGLTLPQILAAEAHAGIRNSHKAIIMILLPGGPPHLDMYDLKPDAPAEIRGEFKPIKTKVPGIDICELMPRMAGIMDKLVAVRSIVGSLEEHSLHQVLTGWESHPPQGDSPNRPGYPQGGWPTPGAVLSRHFGPADPAVPPFVSLAFPQTLFTSRASLGQPGYFGQSHAAFEALNVDRGDIVLKGASLEQIADRKSLLASLDGFRREVDTSGMADSLDAINRRALDVLTSNKVAEALNLDREPDSVRRHYGIPDGAVPVKGSGKHLEQFLMARRLVEAGVRCVTLTFTQWPLGRMMAGDFNWDWHAKNFMHARNTLPLLDQGITALVEDLEARGRLGDVSIVVWGEFGRSPKINEEAGRDHWPLVNSCLLAGGGMRGASDRATNRLGEFAAQRPVHYREIFTTLYHNLGIDVRQTMYKDPSGRPQHLVDAFDPIRELV